MLRHPRAAGPLFEDLRELERWQRIGGAPDAIVGVDASGGTTFRRQLSPYLRRKIDREGGLIRKIKHADFNRGIP